MNLGHPVLQDMIKLGCKSQVKIFLAFQTYLELCEVKKFIEVDYCYSTELDLIYLIAHVNGEIELYLPFSQNDYISPKRIQAFQQALLSNLKAKDINIVIRDVDSSSVIYKITSGLEKPISPEVSKEIKDLKDKRNMVEIEISHLFPTLVQQARNNSQLAI